MRLILSLAILLVSLFGFSQETEKLTTKKLKLELANFLLEKNLIKSIDNHISLYGIHKNKVDEELINGIYGFSNISNHSQRFFVIIDNDSFNILDISALQGLKNSISITLEFANKQNYCTEITQDYISRLINVHYNINRNPKKRYDKNCDFERKPTTSIYDLNTLSLKLAEFLIEKKELENIEQYLDNSDFLIVSKMDIYHGVDREKKIECGIYTFAYLDNEVPIFRYVIINEDNIEIFDIDSFKNLYSGINIVLDFAEKHSYCHIKTKEIIEELIGDKFLNSCFDNVIFKLP